MGSGNSCFNHDKSKLQLKQVQNITTTCSIFTHMHTHPFNQSHTNTLYTDTNVITHFHIHKWLLKVMQKIKLKVLQRENIKNVDCILANLISLRLNTGNWEKESDNFFKEKEFPKTENFP